MPRKGETKYKSEYCDQLLEHMGAGFSFESFAGRIGVHKQTLYNWVSEDKGKKEFRDAKDLAFSRCLLFWEAIGIKGARGKIPGFNAASWIFNMKNRFGYRDRAEHLVADSNSGHFTLSYNPKD